LVVERVSITMTWVLRKRLQERAGKEGPILSNLIAHLLKAATA
jgi:hypothetical protein